MIKIICHHKRKEEKKERSSGHAPVHSWFPWKQSEPITDLAAKMVNQTRVTHPKSQNNKHLIR